MAFLSTKVIQLRTLPHLPQACCANESCCVHVSVQQKTELNETQCVHLNTFLLSPFAGVLYNRAMAHVAISSVFQSNEIALFWSFGCWEKALCSVKGMMVSLSLLCLYICSMWKVRVAHDKTFNFSYYINTS